MTDASPIWRAVDAYYADIFGVSDPLLDRVLENNNAAGLPAIGVSALQGRMLMLLAQAMGARRILEIGTLGGYSTIWLARALTSDGMVVTLEVNPKHAEVARTNLANAGFSSLVEVMTGPAADSMTQLIDAGVKPFDFIFIDADKGSYPVYLELALKLTRHGSVIVADNMVRKGGVIDAGSGDIAVQGVRNFNDALAKNNHIVATAIQTVGDKGYDGFVLARVSG